MIVPGPDNRTCRFLRGAIYLWIAVLVLALDPRTEDPATPIKQVASGVAAAGIVLAWAFALRTNRAPYRNASHVVSCLLLFLSVLAVSAAVSDAPGRGILALTPWVTFALIGFIAYQTCPHTRHLRNLFRVIVACVAVSSSYGLAQHVGWDPFPWANRDVEEYRALPATYGNPNLAGHVLVVALVLCAGLLADAWQRKRWSEFLVYLVPGTLMAAHLGFTQMRAGLLALAMAIVFVTVTLEALRRLQRPGHAVSRSWYGAWIGLSACAALLLALTAAALAMAPLLGLDSSIQLRLNGYAGAAALFLDNPLSGVGPGNYAFHNIPYWTSLESLWYALENKRNFHVHNEWLEMAAECGIPGLAAFIGLFLFSIVTFFENPWLAAEKHWGLLMAIPAAMVAMATDACFGFNLLAPVSSGVFFLLLALRPARPFYNAPLRQTARRATVPLSVVALGIAWVQVSDYQHERRFQEAQGAVAWTRTDSGSGATSDFAMHASGLLEALTRQHPGDYRGWMLRGDFALEQGRPALAVEVYGQALALHPHLPRLHIQRARGYLRMSQEQNADVGPALDTAKYHVDHALERCPELAEAWAMLGWASYVKTTLPALNASDEDRRSAIANFQRARELGLTGDTNLEAALGELYARLEAWPNAAQALERCVALDPANPQHWMGWNEAATHAGGTALIQHEQALLQHIGKHTAGDQIISDPLATWMAGRLAAIATSAAQRAMANRALKSAIAADPSLAGLWGAWLGLAPEAERVEALSRMLEAIPASQRGMVSPVAFALESALGATSPDTLVAAGQTLARALATAPGAEDVSVASIHAPLVTMLEHAMRESGLPDAALGRTIQALGAARFETGDLQDADALLRAAEAVLPASELAPSCYYHSRTLAALGQYEAALAMAKAAQDEDGDVVEYQWQLARCLAAGGHADAARFAFDSLLGSLALDHPYRALVERDRQALSAGEKSP